MDIQIETQHAFQVDDGKRNPFGAFNGHGKKLPDTFT